FFPRLRRPWLLRAGRRRPAVGRLRPGHRTMPVRGAGQRVRRPAVRVTVTAARIRPRWVGLTGLRERAGVSPRRWLLAPARLRQVIAAGAEVSLAVFGVFPRSPVLL